MPHRRPSSAPQPRGNFRQRYDAIEARRALLAARLGALGESAKRHPAYRGALKLLNETFRRTKLPKRLAVLQAAAWLIDVLEQVSATGVDHLL